jgi:exosortase C (VPDSG-CTERM-specific)
MSNQENSLILKSQPSARRGLWFIAFAGLLAGLFIKPLAELAVHAAHSDVHSHILLVPLISAYLVYLRREILPQQFGSAPGWGFIFLLLGTAAAMAALPVSDLGRGLSHNDYLSFMALSFVCLLVAGGFFLLGRRWMAALAFPFFFLIFMIPLPDRAVDFLETASKLGSTEAADFFFNITGTPVLRDGTVFQLPGITIQVAKECSGIRSSWILIVTSLLAANLFLNSPWRRAVLVLFTIPLGIVRNGFRVWTIATLCIHYGPNMIHSIVHRRGGPFFFTLALGPLFILLWWLRRGDLKSADQSGGDVKYMPSWNPAAVEADGRSGAGAAAQEPGAGPTFPPLG